MAGKWRLTVVGVRRHPGRVWDVGSWQGATNTMSGVSLPACQAKVGPVWQPLAPQSHLGPCLLCLEVLERLSCPLLHPREPISVLTCRGPGANTLQIQYDCIDYHIQMHNRFTTTYEYATNTVQYTHTRRGARGKGADCSWGEV